MPTSSPPQRESGALVPLLEFLVIFFPSKRSHSAYERALDESVRWSHSYNKASQYVGSPEGKIDKPHGRQDHCRWENKGRQRRQTPCLGSERSIALHAGCEEQKNPTNKQPQTLFLHLRFHQRWKSSQRMHRTALLRCLALLSCMGLLIYIYRTQNKGQLHA